MLVILKIPVAYLCAVVWWAVRAEPRPEDVVGVSASLEPRQPLPSCDWRERIRGRARGPRPAGGRRAPAPQLALPRGARS